MTRKKFIKKLMALRFSRNLAVKCANRAKESGIPYDIFYSMLCDDLLEHIYHKFEKYILYGDKALPFAKPSISYKIQARISPKVID